MSKVWTQPPKNIPALIRVGRYAALTAGIIYGWNHYYTVKEKIATFDLNRRNRIFVLKHMMSHLEWKYYILNMNALAKQLKVNERLVDNLESKHSNGFKVNRADYFPDGNDPWNGDLKKMYADAGAVYYPWYGEEFDKILEEYKELYGYNSVDSEKVLAKLKETEKSQKS